MPPLLQPNGRALRLVGLTWFLAAAVFAAGTLRLAAAEPERSKVAAGLAPRFTPEGGVFTGAVTLRLEADSPSVVVRYTLDGAEPSAKSEVYSNALHLTLTSLVRARAFVGNQPAGPTVSQTYTFLGKDLETFTSNLPLVILNTFGHEVEHANKLAASARFLGTREGRSSFLQPADFEGRVDIHVRGNSSLRYLKRSYGLKTRDEEGKARSVSILGFP